MQQILWVAIAEIAGVAAILGSFSHSCHFHPIDAIALEFG
jgi:hypothetical protein